MKYRIKLYLCFGGLLLAIVFLAEGVTYFEAKDKYIELLRSRVEAVAFYSAQSINAADVETVKEQLDDKNAAFASLVNKLSHIRSQHRSALFFIQYIYIIAPNPQNPNQIIVIADASEGSNYAKPGTEYPEGVKIGILQHLEVAYSPLHIVRDRWGKFLPGYAPIVDANGKYIATLGLNISADFIDHSLDRMKWIGLSAMAIALIAGFGAATLLANGLTRSLNRIRMGLSKIVNQKTQVDAESFSQDEFGDLARAIQSFSMEREEQDRIKLHFHHNVSSPIMDKILQSERMPNMGGEKRKITVLSSDIRHFTHFTETLSPEQVVNLLNEFISVMYEVVFAHNGTIDKVLGDVLIIEFGAPLEDLLQETHAIETAVAMQEALNKLNQKWDSQGRPQLSMVIGIHTDQSILANIGTEARQEYTAIGNAVNTSLRVRDAAKRLDVPILISETTWIPARNRFETKDLGPLYLKGKTKSIKIYSVEIPS